MTLRSPSNARSALKSLTKPRCVSFSCGHTYCNRPTCGSRLVDTCPECRLPVASRVQLFGALPDVGGLLEKEPAAPEVEQAQRLASENAKASLEEIRKRSEEDKAVKVHMEVSKALAH